MFKDLLVHVRYPYTAGVIATVWLGTAFLVSLNHSKLLLMLVLDVAITTIIAIIGFSNPRA